MVNFWTAFVIKIDGLWGDVGDAVALFELGREFKSAVVVGEIKDAVGCKACHAALDKGGVVALDVKGTLFFFGIGEGGGGRKR